MIMSGKQAATLHQVRLVDIHGTRFYDLEYTHDQVPDQLRAARIGLESVYADPRPGNRVLIGYLMNVVTSVERQ